MSCRSNHHVDCDVNCQACGRFCVGWRRMNWPDGGVCDPDYSASSQESRPTRNATAAITGTVSIMTMPKFSIMSPYMIGLYRTIPETITKAIKPTITIRMLRSAREGCQRRWFRGAALIRSGFDGVSGSGFCLFSGMAQRGGGTPNASMTRVTRAFQIGT